MVNLVAPSLDKSEFNDTFGSILMSLGYREEKSIYFRLSVIEYLDFLGEFFFAQVWLLAFMNGLNVYSKRHNLG